MKTTLLITVLFLSCITTFAQINDPVWNQRDFRNFRNEESIKVNPVKSIDTGNMEQKSAGQNYVSDYASNFNPVWANRFQTVLDSLMRANPTSKGASMAVYTPEEGMWTGVSGISHPGVPITPDMRFGIGSNTKLFVAVAILKLQEEGVLNIDDHLYQWLPPIKNVDSTATIRQLLTHQSGIFDFLNDRPAMFQDSIWADTARFWTSPEILATIGPPHFAPGNGYRYSNTNYLLAALVIESATGKTWVQKLHDLIFDPLNLDSTFVGAFEPRNGSVAAELDRFSGNLITNSPMTAEYSMVHGGGSILSTASEMVQWYNALFNGSVISESSMQMMLSFDPSSLYGLGIMVIESYPHSYLHGGGMLGYGSGMIYDIKRKAILCILANGDVVERIVFSLMDVFFYEYPKPINDAGIANVIAPWAYFCNNIITPKVELKNNGSSPLSSVSLNYKIDDGTISVVNWTGLLNPGKTIDVSLPSISPDEGFHEFTCYTTLPNGESEGYTFNDTLRSNFFVNTQASAIPWLFEGFDGNGFPREGWTLNSSSILQWGETPLTGLNGSGAGVANNFDRSGVIGQYRDLQLPLLNVSNLKNTDFSFDFAYASQPGNSMDSLQVSVSEDCGETWHKLFYKGGISLQTSSQTSLVYYPKSTNEWKHESFSLSNFKGNILIRFRARYGYSNNLYIDNIRVGMFAYVQSVTTDKLSYTAGKDTIKTNAVIENPNSHELSARLIFESLDGTVTDSTDTAEFNLTDEAKWQAKWKTYDLPENLYFISLKVTDKTDGTTFTNKHVTRIITAPLLIDSLVIKKSSATKYVVQPYFKNAGKTMEITKLIVKLSSNDKWVKYITPNPTPGPNLLPGQVKKSAAFNITYDTATYEGHFNLKFSISSDGWPYWVFDTTFVDTISGIEPLSLPLSVNLEQNYPNPFNSVTTINWQLAKNSKVTLKVLDIVGRTVATLVDEQRPQGKYETQFNAATLPKGIYFYQLKAGEYSQTRKMILLQ